jgi:hypothetical protein
MNTPQTPPGNASATSGDTSTHFIFKHRIFTIEKCRFAFNGADKMPCFYVPMGEQIVAIELAKLQQEFNIPEDSTDSDLLKKVDKGLAFVSEIRPGDSIPREILDGSASWTVEDRHKDMAVARMNMELMFWVIGMREDMPSLENMQRLQNSSEGRAQIKDAHIKIVQLLGLDETRKSRERAESITRETTYIEALRERSAKIGEIAQKLVHLAGANKKETAFVAEISRMQDLMRRASKVIGDKFGRVDNGMKEIMKVMSDAKGFVETVRSSRDELHMELKKWDEYFPLWAEIKIRDDETEKFFRRFYRFLAENYMETQSWGSQPKKK